MSELGSSEFLQLLITQLTNQDPLQPMGNRELLEQIASIREIEQTTTMTESLRSLDGKQQYAAAATLIGRTVTGTTGDGLQATQGVVVGARFDPGGEALLVLKSGEEIPLGSVTRVEQTETTEDLLEAARSLVGRLVSGTDRSDPASPRAITGIVTGTRTDANGHVALELDTGEHLRMADVTEVGPPAAEAEPEESSGGVIGLLKSLVGL
jgi:flagellar basal-body rod modification protein FlgD